ncbi:flagellar hook-associated protein FlgL [Pelagimonas phthalicica]|uniref:Flagellar hook-associated protein FlgL n=1 Tax=Pelagimonas phthalicica TaxID=1037362 RepID=A0A238J7E7_9RHOB|nr:flagellin [Pelagimonas phthalicica]TDS95332.1 flagellar hook-associated protein 3 FlgL [Pelagimonas phthalicica]SMX26144.1 flagellar hook-associated protein FlgL [Pelagimonas phthalicica]
MQSVGDMARALVLRTNQVRLREEMDKLAVEVSTGFVTDSAKHLNGDLTSLQEIDRTLSKLEAYRINTTEASYITSTMQTSLDEIQSRSQTLSQTLIAADLTPTDPLLNTMSVDAANTLDQVMTGMNRSVAGRTLFGGVATDRPAVADSEDMLADLRVLLAGETTLAGIEAQLDTFFGAGGTYDTVTYEGSNTGLAPFQLSETDSANVDIRASDPVFKEMLKPLAMAALASDGSLGFDTELQVEILSAAGRDLLGAQQSMVELRAGLGALEARIEETTTRNAAETSSASLARLELVGTDQYESAAKYESIRGQLESLYAITARSQRLSLAGYL